MEHTELRKIIGTRLRELRTARRWSQAAVAKLAHVGRDFLGRAERGDREPSLFVLNKLATIFEVQPAFLLTPAAHKGKPMLREIETMLMPRPAGELRWFRELVRFHLANRQPAVAEARPVLPRRPGRAK